MVTLFNQMAEFADSDVYILKSHHQVCIDKNTISSRDDACDTSQATIHVLPSAHVLPNE